MFDAGSSGVAAEDVNSTLYNSGRLCINAIAQMNAKDIIALLSNPATNITIEGYSVLAVALTIPGNDCKAALVKYFLDNPKHVDDLLIPNLYAIIKEPVEHPLHDVQGDVICCAISGEPIPAHECIFIWGKSGYQILSLNSFMLWVNRGEYNCPMTREKVTHVSFPSDLSGLFHPHKEGACLQLERADIIKLPLRKRPLADVANRKNGRSLYKPAIAGTSIFEYMMGDFFQPFLEKNPKIAASGTGRAMAPILQSSSKALRALCRQPRFFTKLLETTPCVMDAIKPRILYEISSQEADSGTSAFFILSFHSCQSGFSAYKKLLENNEEFATELTTLVLHQACLTEGDHFRNTTPFTLLSATEIGIKLLDTLMKYNPALLNMRSCEALLVQCPSGRFKNNSPLLELSAHPSGVELIRKMFSRHQYVLSQMTSNMLCDPTPNLPGFYVSSMIILWGQAANGINMLAEFIIANPKFSALITRTVVNCSQKKCAMENYSLLLLLTLDLFRRSILEIILKNSPNFSKKITIEGLISDVHPEYLPPLHCLASDGVGLRCLELLFQLNPSIPAGITPEMLTAEISKESLEGTLSAKKLLDRTQPGRELLEVINQARKEAMFSPKPTGRPRRASF